MNKPHLKLVQSAPKHVRKKVKMTKEQRLSLKLLHLEQENMGLKLEPAFKALQAKQKQYQKYANALIKAHKLPGEGWTFDLENGFIIPPAPQAKHPQPPKPSGEVNGGNRG